MSGVRRTAIGGLVAGLLAAMPLAAHAAGTGGTPAGVKQLVPLRLGCAGIVAAGRAHCYAEALGTNARPFASTSPTGYGAADIRAAYGLSALSGGGRTVAIVDAYDDNKA